MLVTEMLYALFVAPIGSTFEVKVELAFVTCVIVPIDEKFTITNMTMIHFVIFSFDRTGCGKHKWVFVVSRVLDVAG